MVDTWFHYVKSSFLFTFKILLKFQRALCRKNDSWPDQSCRKFWGPPSKYHDFLAVFALARSKINQIAKNFDEIIQEGSD